MKEKVTPDGKRYIALNEDEINQLPPKTRLYCIDESLRAIPPSDCEHDFKVVGGCPQNIKYCTKCIYWEPTNEPVSEYPVQVKRK